MKRLLGLAAVLAIATMAEAHAATPPVPAPILTDAVATVQDLSAAPIIPVAEGCGPGRWRGPWGGCRGPFPGYWYAPPPPPAYFGGNGCPPGFWRGPWGHCRDTPYHGALPNGGWQ